MYIYYPNRKDAVLCRKHPQIIFQLSSSILPHQRLADDGHVKSAHSVVDLIANHHQLEWLRWNVRGEEIVARFICLKLHTEERVRQKRMNAVHYTRGYTTLSCDINRGEVGEQERESKTKTKNAGAGESEPQARDDLLSNWISMLIDLRYLIMNLSLPDFATSFTISQRQGSLPCCWQYRTTSTPQTQTNHKVQKSIKLRSHNVGELCWAYLTTASKGIGQQSSLSRLVLLASSAKKACAQSFTLLLAILYDTKTANPYKLTRCRSRLNYEVTMLEHRVSCVIGDILGASEEAEDWFHKRLKDIVEGTATPVSNREWKSRLRQTKSAANAFLTNIEPFSADAVFRDN
ncbi:hypothetical protein BC835DRAFT_1311150 [Cytidiella melzeri]|nr:hypothetical protein BC835DRAFT_1311150 [Cytidiella melzeri]